ncbi:MAG: glycosyltransferase family 2 protein [Cytophagales bacterium]|nr:glycosyltransferase family 2 protein [Cytophagales bacterium]
MAIIMLLLWTSGALLVVFLIFPVLARLFSLLTKPGVRGESEKKKLYFACVITAYKDLEITHDLVESLLRQDYDAFQVYLVADRCERKVLPFIEEDPRVKVIFPERPLDSKVRSMQHAFRFLDSEVNQVVVFDPDNLVASDFLSELNKKHQQGYEVVQAKRIARNLGTSTAVMDAMAEYYRNYIDRIVPFRLGFSCSIAGSGMSIPRGTFSGFLESRKIREKSQGVILGEDKMLQIYLIRRGYFIAFAENLLVQDGKLVNGSQVEKQRARWLTAYFESIGDHLRLFFEGIIDRKVSKVFFAFQNIVPPVSILLSWSAVLIVLGLFLDNRLSLLLFVSLVLFVANIYSVLMLQFTGAGQKRAILRLPVFVFRHFLSVRHMPKTRKSFLVTKHLFHNKEAK